MHSEPIKTMQPFVLSWSHMDRCGLPYNHILFLNWYTTPTMDGAVLSFVALYNGGRLTSEP